MDRLLEEASQGGVFVSFWRGIWTVATELLLNQMKISQTTTWPLIFTLVASKNSIDLQESLGWGKDIWIFGVSGSCAAVQG